VGYVGLVTGACLAQLGHEVACIDVDASKIADLNAGRVPLIEEGMDRIIDRGLLEQRLSFTTDHGEGLVGAEVIFIAVGTPPLATGAADLSHVMAAARAIGRHVSNDVTVVVKSTVPVGGNERVFATIQEQLQQRGVRINLSIAANPEFLREGVAVQDFMQPDRIVLGCSDAAACARMAGVYAPLARLGVDLSKILLWTDIRSAELIKYAANAMLATRISFINEVAAIAHAVGADVEEVARGIGADSRIGPQFLRAGMGYGGSCFPKDVRALAQIAREHGVAPRLLESVHAVNETQKGVLFQRLVDFYGDSSALAGRTVAVWGLAFKPGTDDMRDAPSIPLVRALRAAGVIVHACDPAALERARAVFGNDPGLVYFESAAEALVGADVLMVVTEWPQFERVTPEVLLRHLRDKAVFDGRNLFDPAALAAAGVQHFGVGRGAVLSVARPRLERLAEAA
jgi:UDPglucose 6-dehydrogenase